MDLRSSLLADKSSKAGKDAQLLVAGLSPDEQLFLPEAHEKALFFESLATNVPEGDRLLEGHASLETRHRALTHSMRGLRVSPDSRTGELEQPRVPAAFGPLVPGLVRPQEPAAAARHAGDGTIRTACAIDGACRHAELIDFVLSAWTQKSGLPSKARSCSVEREVRCTS